MKKLILLFLAFGMLQGCSIDDDSPQITYELAEIVDYQLPEEFEFGNSYEVNVTYVLPSSCHSFQGLDARREGHEAEKRRTIYVSAIAGKLGESCDSTTGGSQGTSKFFIFIDEEEEYTFNFLVGEENGNPVYETISVPVIREETGT